MPARLLSSDTLPAFLEALRQAPRVAVDTEFHAERRYVPKLYLVQVYVPGGAAWIVDPLQGDLLAQAAPALREVPWIVHGGSQDIRLLGRALGAVPNTILDTQIGSGLVNERFPEGYGSLVQRYLQRTLPKASTLSDWSRRPLSAVQLRYAVDDVLRLPDLWDAIEQKLCALGRSDVALQACKEARDLHLREPAPREAWRAFAAATGMSPRARSILQELAAWRETTAQERNQPRRTILGDGTVVELAKRPPSQRDGILANRRFPRSAQKHVDAIWAAIQRGVARTGEDAPLCPERFSSPWRMHQLLGAWATMLAHQRSFSARLVLDDALLADLSVRPPTSRDEVRSRLGPWRDTLVGDAMWAFFTGRQSLLVGPAGAVLHNVSPVDPGQ